MPPLSGIGDVTRTMRHFPARGSTRFLEHAGARRASASAAANVTRGGCGRRVVIIWIHVPEGCEEAQRLGDVVDAHENGPRPRRLGADGGGRERLREAVRNGRARDGPEKRLARRADDERNAGRREAVERAEEREVLRGRFAESEAGVEEDFSAGIPEESAFGARAFRSAATSATTSVKEDSSKVEEGVPRQWLITSAAPRARRVESIRPGVEAGDDVHHVGARVQRGARDRGAPRVDERGRDGRFLRR